MFDTVFPFFTTYSLVATSNSRNQEHHHSNDRSTGQCTSHRKEISQHAAPRQTSRDDHSLWTHSQHNQTRHLLPHAFWHCTACSRTHSASSPFPRPAIHTVIICKPLEAKQPCRSDPCASASFPRLWWGPSSCRQRTRERDGTCPPSSSRAPCTTTVNSVWQCSPSRRWGTNCD